MSWGKKISDKMVNGIAWYLESASVSNSKSKNFSENEKEKFAVFAEKMKNVKENGIIGIFDELSYSDDSYNGDVDDGIDAYDEEKHEECMEDEIIGIFDHRKENKKIEDKKRDKRQRSPLKEKEINKKVLTSIKKEKEFLMKIEKMQYTEKKSGKGYILSGQIKKGGIYQKENTLIVVSYQDGNKTMHPLISVTCNSQHKRYNYAKKGQFVRLFIESEECIDFSSACLVCDVIYK